jgi:hypothetical protein
MVETRGIEPRRHWMAIGSLSSSLPNTDRYKRPQPIFTARSGDRRDSSTASRPRVLRKIKGDPYCSGASLGRSEDGEQRYSHRAPSEVEGGS